MATFQSGKWREQGMHDLFLSNFAQGGTRWEVLLESTRGLGRSKG